MPGAQRTFQLIPANPNNATSKPPMTSKAAKKAYLKASRGPRVSRAEQRRLDKEELDRQKKEHEKERNVAKAKAVREKKAAKAAEERDQRRKVRLPEPSRFVRASQPTIARFVRGGAKRKLQELDTMAEDSEDTMAEEASMLAGAMEPPVKRVVVEQESDDEFGDFPSLSQTDILEKINSSILSVREDTAIPISSLNRVDQDFPSMLQTVLSVSPKSKRRPSTPRPNVKASPKGSPPCCNEGLSINNYLRERSLNMPPPAVPLKRRKAITFAASPNIPTPMPRNQSAKHFTTLAKNVPPPSATQLFLENSLDDFLPSQSQEIRELLDDVEDFPSNTQIAKELCPQRPIAGLELALKPKDEVLGDLFSTQDFALSSQDVIEINTPSRASPIRMRNRNVPVPPKIPIPRPPKKRFFVEKEDDIYHAALNESKKLAAAEEKARQAQQAAKPITPAANTRGERTLQRVQSITTDYGEDDFLSSQDLRELCK